MHELDASDFTLDLSVLHESTVRALATTPWRVVETEPMHKGVLKVQTPAGNVYAVQAVQPTEERLRMWFESFQGSVARWLALPLHTPGVYGVTVYSVGPTMWRVEPADSPESGMHIVSEDGASRARLEHPAGLVISPWDLHEYGMNALRQAAERAAEIRRRLGRFT
jgi:hypothetical protein